MIVDNFVDNLWITFWPGDFLRGYLIFLDGIFDGRNFGVWFDVKNFGGV